MRTRSKFGSAADVMVRKPRSWKMCLGYISLRLFIFVLAIAAAGATYQRFESNRDRNKHPAPGHLVDMGGYRMHLYCSGTGSPTVVFDSGLSDSYLSWYKVQPEVAQFTRACSYDRAGLGWSEPSPKLRNSGVFAEELHALLHTAGIHAPFLLVGHSMGGYDVRIFASRFRSEVTGMVLVDATHPDYANLLPELRTGLESWRNQLKRQELLMPFGLPRLLGWCGNGPSEIQAELRAIECNVPRLRESIAETLSTWDESAAQVRASGSLGNLPLIVISEDPAKNTPAFLSVFESGQEQLASLSSNSVRMTAIGSGHQIQRERPDLVIQAIKNIFETTEGRPLK
jgi:pimeloyl-ACP methyl ester carboxylesterase